MANVNLATEIGIGAIKDSIRNQTWNKLEYMNEVVFPRPCNFRIPRFKGEKEAVWKLARLQEFKTAKLIKFSADKSQEIFRLEAIKEGKSLIVGTPGLRGAAFLLMRPPINRRGMSNRMAASRLGIFEFGSFFSLHDNVKVDLVVLGSVAVDKKGRRIGKGEGFTDLEYALLSKFGIITQDTVIVTVVHDLQVYEEFPESIFAPWDVPVDIIITPTSVRYIQEKLPRPVFEWNFLSYHRIQKIKIIKKLFETEQLAGAYIILKEVDSETEGRSGFNLQLHRMKRIFFCQRQLLSVLPDEQPQGAIYRMQSSRGYTFCPLNLQNNATKNRVANNELRIELARSIMNAPLGGILLPRYTMDVRNRHDGQTSGTTSSYEISWEAAKKFFYPNAPSL